MAQNPSIVFAQSHMVLPNNRLGPNRSTDRQMDCYRESAGRAPRKCWPRCCSGVTARYLRRKLIFSDVFQVGLYVKCLPATRYSYFHKNYINQQKINQQKNKFFCVDRSKPKKQILYCTRICNKWQKCNVSFIRQWQKHKPIMKFKKKMTKSRCIKTE